MIKFYNAIDEVVREFSKKNHAYPFAEGEKYYILNDGDPVLNPDFSESEELAKLKAAKKGKIKQKTDYILDSNTFTYGGKTYNNGFADMIIWIGLMQVHQNGSLLFPVKLQDSNGESVELSQADFEGAHAAGFSAIKSIIDADTDLKDSIVNASSAAELKSIEDDR
jgi:hypothetical protein